MILCAGEKLTLAKELSWVWNKVQAVVLAFQVSLKKEQKCILLLEETKWKTKENSDLPDL